MHHKRLRRWPARAVVSLAAGFALAGSVSCSDGVEVPNPLTNPKDGPPAGNPNAEATCSVPAEAGLADVSKPTTIVGTGTPASCFSPSSCARCSPYNVGEHGGRAFVVGK